MAQPNLDAAIAALAASVDKLTTVEESAVALINGIAARIQAAVDTAIANGATPAEVQPVLDAVAKINADADTLAAAVAANT